MWCSFPIYFYDPVKNILTYKNCGNCYYCKQITTSVFNLDNHNSKNYRDKYFKKGNK